MTTKQAAMLTAAVGLIAALTMIAFGMLWPGVIVGLACAIPSGWLTGTRMAHG